MLLGVDNAGMLLALRIETKEIVILREYHALLAGRELKVLLISGPQHVGFGRGEDINAPSAKAAGHRFGDVFVGVVIGSSQPSVESC